MSSSRSEDVTKSLFISYPGESLSIVWSKGCLKGVPFMGVSRKFHRSFRYVSRGLKEVSRVFHVNFKGVSRVFQRCFKDISCFFLGCMLFCFEHLFQRGCKVF